MIFTSPDGALPLPANHTLWDDLEQHAEDTPDAPSIVCGITDDVLTYKQLYERARHVAAGLYADGVRKGDPVVLLSHNCVEYPIIYLALYRLQAICSPTSTLHTANEIANQINATKAKALIVHSSLLELGITAAKLANLTPAQVYTIAPVINQDATIVVPSIQNFMEKPHVFPNLPRVDPDAVLALPFSSGTTNRPKGVELTGRAIYAAALQTASREEDYDYVLGLSPFYHIFATSILHMTIQVGTAIVVLPSFEAKSFLRVVVKYQLRNLPVAPPVVPFLANNPLIDEYDLSCVKYIGCGGASVSNDVVRQIEKRLGVLVRQGYGMTELAGAVTSTEHGNARLGAVGRLLPNVELMVKSLTTDEELGVNRRGELLFRTPQTMRGYLRDAEATQETMTNDGFLRSGDVGYIDQDGFVFMVDRIKSLIKYKGHQVGPAEIEDALNSHPLVVESCCVRGRHKVTGEEIPKAFVMLRDDGMGQICEQELIEFLFDKVATFKRVREIEFIDSIVKTPAGKVPRHALQAREMAKWEVAPASGSRI